MSYKGCLSLPKLSGWPGARTKVVDLRKVALKGRFSPLALTGNRSDIFNFALSTFFIVVPLKMNPIGDWNRSNQSRDEAENVCPCFINSQDWQMSRLASFELVTFKFSFVQSSSSLLAAGLFLCSGSNVLPIVDTRFGE